MKKKPKKSKNCGRFTTLKLSPAMVAATRRMEEDLQIEEARVGLQSMGQPVNGCELITLERYRQLDEEKYSWRHDDTHKQGELVAAAVNYAICAFGQQSDDINNTKYHELECPISEYPVWPFGAEFWKPSPDPMRNLVKAGALIAAEIDRLQRAKK